MAPVVVEVIAAPLPRDELVGALLKSCSTAVGGAGCTLDAQDRPEPARARVVVRFFDGLARVRVELAAPAPSSKQVREVSFRGDDPSIERFHAAGLIAAGLVDDHETSRPPSSPSGAPLHVPPPRVASGDDVRLAPPSPPPPVTARGVEGSSRVFTPVDLSTAALVGWTDARSWWGAIIQSDFRLGRSSFFATASTLYMQTWTPSSAGISEQRAELGAGAGVAVRLGLGVRLRFRVSIELNEVRASLVQPDTGRQDSGGRSLLGGGAGADVAVPLGGAFALVGGGRGAWLGDSTKVFVQGKSVATKITFKPDVSIFTAIEFQYDILASRLRELSFLNAGFLITLTDERDGGRNETFQYKGGIREFVDIPAWTYGATLGIETRIR